MLGPHADPHLDTLVQILTSFELCYELRGSNPIHYNFPCFVTMPLEYVDWEPDPNYVYYHGRRVQCNEELDCLPSGLFNRLQVRVCNLYTDIHLFKDAFIVREKNAVCLVKMDEMNNQITMIARALAESVNHTTHHNRNAHNCFLVLDIIHQQLWKLLKVACPNISIKWHILSPMDLKAHKEDPHVYKCEEVVSVIHSNAQFINRSTGQAEEALDVLYCGSKQVEEQRSGESMPIAYLPDHVLEGLEELLGDLKTPKVRLQYAYM